VSNDLPQDDAGPPKKRQKGGRPKGTTIENSQEEIERYKKAVAEVAQDYKNALNDVEKQALHHSSGRRHIRKGTLDRIIEYAKKKHNVDHLEIPKETIKSRVKRRRQWTKAKLKLMCLYKKVKGDKGLPDDGVAPSSLE
jgi:hypothetical protein